MRNRRFFFGTLIGSAFFIYLLGSFLLASFDIGLWMPIHRFVAVAVYLFLVFSFLRALAPEDEPSKKELKREEAVNA